MSTTFEFNPYIWKNIMSFNLYGEEEYVGILTKRYLKKIQEIFNEYPTRDAEDEAQELRIKVRELILTSIQKHFEQHLQTLYDMEDTIQNMIDSVEEIVLFIIRGIEEYNLDEPLAYNDEISNYYDHIRDSIM